MTLNWLDELVEMNAEFECPKSYIRWAGLAAISAICKKNVWVDRYAYKVFPNIYVMLVGPPGIKKSYATNLGKNLVETVNNTRIISGINSIEGILKELSQTKTNEDGTPPDLDANVLIHSNEFSNLVIENPQALTVLLELYDSLYNKNFTKTLAEKKFTIKNPCITMLTACNNAHFANKIKQVDVEGGFIGRTMVVLETNVNRRNALVRKPKRFFNPELAADRLRGISKIRGEFNWGPDGADSLFEEWYNSFSEEYQTDETGIYQRMDDHVLKVAMLTSIADSDELVLTKRIVQNSIDLCLSLNANVRNITAGAGTSEISAAQMAFMRTLIRAEDFRVEKVTMLRKNWGTFEVNTMNRVVETLQQSGLIVQESTGNKIYYRLTDEATATYLRAKEN